MNKLAIVGGGSTRLNAPFEDKTFDIWSTFSVGQELPRVDACFEIHDGVYSPEKLQALGCKIYMKEVTIPNGERFPIEELEKNYGKRFNGTVVMILAYAIMRGYEEIWLYGVDFSADAEYSRRNMFYWMMGFATAVGAKIVIPEGGLLYDTCKTYAYEDDGKDYLRYMRNRLESQTANDQENLIIARERIAYSRGVMETLNQVERRH
jgi:hypothetical protein